MSEPVVVEKKSSFISSGPFRAIVVVLVLAVIGVAAWWWITQGRESTDDAQVDAHVIPMASRVGGTVLKVPVEDNQLVEAGTVLVEIDPRDYQVAVDKARAELADAEAAAIAAQSAGRRQQTLARESMKTKVAINGLGRIGRAILKLVIDESSLDLVAVNDLANVESLAYLLRFDSAYGPYRRRVAIEGSSQAAACTSCHKG